MTVSFGPSGLVSMQAKSTYEQKLVLAALPHGDSFAEDQSLNAVELPDSPPAGSFFLQIVVN